MLCSACLDGSGRSYQEYIADINELSDAATQIDGAPSSDAQTPLCSEAGLASIHVLFTNKTGQNGRLMWANESCVLTQYAEIAAGQSYTQQTYVGHAWRFLAVGSDRLLDQVRIVDGQTEVDFQ